MKRPPAKGPRTAVSRRHAITPRGQKPFPGPSEIPGELPPGQGGPQAPVSRSPSPVDAEEGAAMSVREHLLELRTRLIRCILAVLVGFFVCYSFSEQLFTWLAAPLQQTLPEGSTMMFTKPTEGFMVDMQIAMVAGVVVASPYVFYQLWSFVAPGLYKEERRNIIPLTLGSALLFLAGAAFCYFGAFPVAFKFFMSFTRPGIRAAITLDSYLGFSLRMILAFGIIFQMPLLSYFLAKLGIISAASLRAWRKYAIVGNFIVAAIVTPPDIFSQIFMVGPLLLLYELSIWVCTFASPKRPLPEKTAAGI